MLLIYMNIDGVRVPLNISIVDLASEDLIDTQHIVVENLITSNNLAIIPNTHPCIIPVLRIFDMSIPTPSIMTVFNLEDGVEYDWISV